MAYNYNQNKAVVDHRAGGLVPEAPKNHVPLNATLPFCLFLPITFSI